MGMFETIVFGMSAAFICGYTLCFIKNKPRLRAFWGAVTMVFITLSAYNWRLALIDSGKNPAWLGFERYPLALMLVVIMFAGGLYLLVSGLKNINIPGKKQAGAGIILPADRNASRKRHGFLLNAYKHQITPVEKELSALELANYFTSILDVEKITLAEVPERFLAYNFENAYVNSERMPLEEGIWHAYKVLHNQKSEWYYKESLVQHSPYLWFICEEKTGYYTSNSQLLFLEMELKRGISTEDYENETVYFFNYLERYDAYMQQKRHLERGTWNGSIAINDKQAEQEYAVFKQEE